MTRPDSDYAERMERKADNLTRLALLVRLSEKAKGKDGDEIRVMLQDMTDSLINSLDMDDKQ